VNKQESDTCGCPFQRRSDRARRHNATAGFTPSAFQPVSTAPAAMTSVPADTCAHFPGASRLRTSLLAAPIPQRLHGFKDCSWSVVQGFFRHFAVLHHVLEDVLERHSVSPNYCLDETWIFFGVSPASIHQQMYLFQIPSDWSTRRFNEAISSFNHL